jgi:hypothetical protein
MAAIWSFGCDRDNKQEILTMKSRTELFLPSRMLYQQGESGNRNLFWQVQNF